MRFKKPFGGFAPVFVGVVLANSAIASEDSVKLESMEVSDQGVELKSYKVEQMGTATKFDLSSMETPQSVSVMTDVQMKDFGLQDVNSVIDNMAGLNVEKVETDRTYYISRGFVVTNFQVDGLGMPLSNDNTHGNFDSAIYQRVEVVRGANGFMSGAGEPSATINFVRKRPTDKFQGDLSATMGSWNKQRVEADLSGGLTDNVRVRAVAVEQKNESYLDRYEHDRSVQYGVMEVDVTDDTLLTLSYSHQVSLSDSPLWGALELYATDGSEIEYDVSTSSSSDWSFWDAKVTRRYLDLTHTFDNDWRIRAAYTDLHTDEDSELFYTYRFDTPANPPGEAVVLGYASLYQRDQNQELFDIYARGPLSLLGRQHDLVVGYSKSKVRTEDLSLYDFTTGNGFPFVGDLSEWDGDTPRPTFEDGATGGTVKDFQESAYTAFRVSVLDNLKFLVGARVSDWSSKGVYYGDDKATSHDDEVTTNVGIVFDITDNIMTYASASEIFKPQKERDLDNNRLDPVEGESKEIGLKGEFLKGKLLATAALFQTDQKNLAKSVGINPVTGQQAFEAADGIESDGYEIELTGEIQDGWALSASYTYVNVDVDNLDDKNIDNYTPSEMFKLATRYQLPMLPKLKVGANLKWKSEYSQDIGDITYTDPDTSITTVLAEDVSVEQGSYYLLDLMAKYDFTDNVNVTFNANNITDEKYLTSLYWQQSHYGAPRNYQLTVNLKL